MTLRRKKVSHRQHHSDYMGRKLDSDGHECKMILRIHKIIINSIFRGIGDGELKFFSMLYI